MSTSRCMDRETEHKINTLSESGKAFLFILDFELEKPLVYPLDELPEGIRFSLPEWNDSTVNTDNSSLQLNAEMISRESFDTAFEMVMDHIKLGHSYLVNLSFRIPLNADISLEKIYRKAKAKYKLILPEKFVVFSPEPFIRIDGDTISTFPMKGTIDASIANAEKILMEDEKELAEHRTVVDLLRNDLSMVSTNVSVDKFRFLEKIQTAKRELIQSSSQIKGRILPEYHKKIGTILSKICPAGSVSGAPKTKVLEIIRDAEKRKRGYYTGVFGIYDGIKLDSAVMIRYIEKKDDRLYYRSGAGITSKSIALHEYTEIFDKIYVPTA